MSLPRAIMTRGVVAIKRAARESQPLLPALPDVVPGASQP